MGSSSPNRGENKTYLKPAPSLSRLNFVSHDLGLLQTSHKHFFKVGSAVASWLSHLPGCFFFPTGQFFWGTVPLAAEDKPPTLEAYRDSDPSFQITFILRAIHSYLEPSLGTDGWSGIKHYLPIQWKKVLKSAKMEISRCSNWMVPNHSNRHHLFSTFNPKKCSPENIYVNMVRYPNSHSYLTPELISFSKAHNMFYIHLKLSGKVSAWQRSFFTLSW